MYCTTCGKQIIDTARFCNFCGAPVQKLEFTEPTQQAAPSYADAVQPESTSTSSYPEAAQPESMGVPSYPEAAQSKSTEVSSYPEAAQPESMGVPSYSEPVQTESIGDSAYPETVQPDSIGTSSYSETVQPESAGTADNVVGTFSVPSPGQISTSGVGTVSPEIKPAKPLPERKYTFGHIMLCLGAVAVMAITAGVFAGLYFSVV